MPPCFGDSFILSSLKVQVKNFLKFFFSGSLESRPLGRGVCRLVSATSNTIPALLSQVNTFYDKIVFFMKIFNLIAAYTYIPVIFALKQTLFENLFEVFSACIF